MTAVPALPLRLLARHWGKLTLAVAVLAIVLVMRWKPVVVERQVIATGTLAQEVPGTGTLEARTRATVAAKIAGRIDVIAADQGDQVKQGQMLAHIDDTDLRRQVAAAEAGWRAGQASVVRAKADLVRLQTVVDQARRERQRIAPLRAANIVSQEADEQARNA
jgi:multidrug efflux pump subunit AcrA (membrane-fusion protein)